MSNPRNHPVDVVTAYAGENRTVPTTASTAALIAEWKDKDKTRLFLSRVVSGEFLYDFESTVAGDNELTLNLQHQ